MDIEITVFNNDGTVASHYKGPADTATDAEINDMVAMIEAGTPAHIAGFLAKQHGCACEPNGSDGLQCPDENGKLLCSSSRT